MSNLKKFVNVLSVVGVLAVSTVTTASADTSQVKLNRELVKKDTLHLLLEDVNMIAKAYQISLKIDGNVKLDSLNFTNAGQPNVETKFVYDEKTNEIDVYVTSTQSLLNANDDIDLGELAFKGTEGERFDVVPVANSLKIVTTANTEYQPSGIETSGGTDFTIGGSSDRGDSGGSDGGNNGGNNGGSDGGNDGGSIGGEEKPDEKPPIEKPVEKPVENPNKLEGALKFGDLASSYRAYEEISYLSVGMIIAGDSGKFVPSRQVTRAEAAAMIGRALGLEGEKRPTTFKDVGTSNFASGYIQSAVESKILSGYGDGTFRPNQVVNRGEMAIMISRAFGYEYDGTTTGAGKELISKGISQGVGDGTFGSPQKLIRADFAVFLARAIDSDLRIGKPTISFDDEKSVNVDSLAVRTGPSELYSQASQIGKNAKVNVGYKVGKWSVIKTEKDVVGFVPNESLK